MQKFFVLFVALVLGGFAYWSFSGPGEPEPTAAEMAAVKALKEIVQAQKVYEQRNGRYAEHLYELGPAGEGLIHHVLAGSGKVAGYQMRLRGYGDSYQLSADPPDGTVNRYFYSDASEVVRQNRGGPATSSSEPLG